MPEQDGKAGHGAPPAQGSNTLSERTLSGFNWALLTSGSQAGLSLAIVMVLSRLLTPEHFGQLAIGLVFLTLADTAVRRGFGPALVQRFHLTRRHVSAGFALSFGAGLFFAALIFGMAPQLAALIGQPDIAPILRVLSLATVLSGASVVSEHELRRELRFRVLMAAAVGSQCLAGGAGIALALLGQGVWSLVVGALVRQAVFSLVVIVCAPPPRGFRARGDAAADLMRTGIGFSSIALLNVLSSRGVRLVIAGTLGAAQLGLFTRASSLADAPKRITLAMREVLIPAMSRRQTETGRLRAVHGNGSEMLSLAVLPFGALLIVAAPEVIAAILGEQWEGAVPVLRVLALVGMIQTLGALHVPVIRALGAVYRETWRRAAYLCVSLAGVIAASQKWGLIGAAAAVCMAQAMLFAMLARLALSLLGVHWTGFLRRQLPALWASLCSGAALWVVSGFARTAGVSATSALILQVFTWLLAAAASVYVAPALARPRFPRWALDRLPFDSIGPTGRFARALLTPLAART